VIFWSPHAVNGATNDFQKARYVFVLVGKHPNEYVIFEQGAWLSTPGGNVHKSSV